MYKNFLIALIVYFTRPTSTSHQVRSQVSFQVHYPMLICQLDASQVLELTVSFFLGLSYKIILGLITSNPPHCYKTRHYPAPSAPFFLFSRCFLLNYYHTLAITWTICVGVRIMTLREREIREQTSAFTSQDCGNLEQPIRKQTKLIPNLQSKPDPSKKAMPKLVDTQVIVWFYIIIFGEIPLDHCCNQGKKKSGKEWMKMGQHKLCLNYIKFENIR